MKRFFMLAVLVWSSAFLFADVSASTNAVPVEAVAPSVTNAPTVKLLRTQCEAFTKSGSRCKRNAPPGAKLCRQHQKIKAKAVR